MNRAVLGDVVVCKGEATLQLLSLKDQTLVVGRNACRGTKTQILVIRSL